MQTEDLKLVLKNATLAQTIEHLDNLEQRKKDFVVPASRVTFNGQHATFDMDGYPLTFAPNDVAVEHLAAKLEIPLQYLRKCKAERPQLFDDNVNGWLAKAGFAAKPKHYLLRTYLNEDGDGGTLRGFLSDKYFAYDNLDLMKVILSTVRTAAMENGLDIRVSDCDLSERRMYLRFYSPDIQGTAENALRNYRAPKGGGGGALGVSNGIVTGFVVSNSEVGYGSLRISPRVTVLACNNGMIWQEEGFRRTHLGAKLDEGEVAWSNETLISATKLVENQTRDMVRRYLSPDFMAQRVADIEAMAAVQLEHPAEAVRNIGKQHLGMTDEQVEGVFDYFLQQGSARSLFDVAQAVTYFAQHNAQPDQRYELEAAVTTLTADVAQRYDTRKTVRNINQN